MKIKSFWLVAGLTGVLTQTTVAEEKLATLKVGIDTYTNVTVTTVTLTDIYFTHASGIGNAKLKNLPPGLQKKFNFNPEQSREVEQKQIDATAKLYKATAAQAKEQKNAATKTNAKNSDNRPDPVVPKLYAKSFRGETAPPFLVEKWITPKPVMAGKFVLLDFWATWCPPCRRSIPGLNELQEKFKDRLVVVGLSDEAEADVRRFADPKITYSVAIDPAARTKRQVEVTGIPHAILIDPTGIVRFEGMPHYLTESDLKLLLDRYGN